MCLVWSSVILQNFFRLLLQFSLWKTNSANRGFCFHRWTAQGTPPQTDSQPSAMEMWQVALWRYDSFAPIDHTTGSATACCSPTLVSVLKLKPVTAPMARRSSEWTSLILLCYFWHTWVCPMNLVSGSCSGLGLSVWRSGSGFLLVPG